MTGPKKHLATVLAGITMIVAPALAVVPAAEAEHLDLASRTRGLVGSGTPGCAMGMCDDGGTVTLSIAAADPEHAFLNICGTYSWCAMSGPLWQTVALRLSCSVVEGSKWYGGAWVRTERWSWWTFKVVDGAPGTSDRIGVRRPTTPEVLRRTYDGACGARRLHTVPLLAGDFHIVSPPG